MKYEARVSADAYRAYATIAHAAKELDIRWMVTGAAGRVLLLETVYGLPRGRATEDVDFAVMVESWDHYHALEALILKNSEFVQDNKQRQRFRGSENAYFDLIPFGGVEKADHTIAWPPDNNFTMNVLGFREACADAVIVRMNGKTDVPVVSPAGLMLLKLIAWKDRHISHPRRDAADIAYVLRHFGKIETEKRLFERYFDAIKAADYDLDIATARVLGRKTCAIVTNGTRRRLHQLLDVELVHGEDSDLVYEISNRLEPASPDRVLTLLQAYLAGLLDGARIQTASELHKQPNAPTSS